MARDASNVPRLVDEVGGREVRVYVQEDRVDDLGAVTLSNEIAKKISQEMRFPGQIRVTVIRELRATEVAG